GRGVPARVRRGRRGARADGRSLRGLARLSAVDRRRRAVAGRDRRRARGARPAGTDPRAVRRPVAPGGRARLAPSAARRWVAAGEPWRDATVAALEALVRPRGIYERSEGPSRRKEGLESRRALLAGDAPPAEIEIECDGVRQWVDVTSGQKTGAYLDQRLNRT